MQWKEQKAMPPQSPDKRGRSLLIIRHQCSRESRMRVGRVGGGDAFHVLARFTSVRSSLEYHHQAERISSRIVVPEFSLSRKPFSRTTSLLTISHSPTPLRLPESAVPHSDEPIFRPVAIALYTTVCGYEERRRARKRLLVGGGERGGKIGGLIRVPPTDTLARMSATMLSALAAKNRNCLRQDSLTRDFSWLWLVTLPTNLKKWKYSV